MANAGHAHTQVQTKVCGIGSSDDYRMAWEAGVDWVGVNFSPLSKRFVALEDVMNWQLAAVTANTDHPRPGLVGVFVDSSPDEMAAIAKVAALDFVQMHGQEPTDVLRAFRTRLAAESLNKPVGVIKAMTPDMLRAAPGWGGLVDVVLVDAAIGAQAGQGHLAGTDAVAQAVRGLSCPWWLAGGLSPDNVAEQLALLKPHGVDVASGVEVAGLPTGVPSVPRGQSTSRKDSAAMRAFVMQVRKAEST